MTFATPEVSLGDLVVTRYGDFAVEVYEIDPEEGILVGYDRDEEQVRFRVTLGDLLDMRVYHNAVLEIDGRTDKSITVSDDGRHVQMLDRPSMS